MKLPRLTDEDIALLGEMTGLDPRATVEMTDEDFEHLLAEARDLRAAFEQWVESREAPDGR